MSDIYYVPEREGSGAYREKMSRFLSFAVPVSDGEAARETVKRFQNEYHDARHVCWAYMIGPDRKEWQLNDNGEPSGTAGKPILGQINSFGVTDVVVVVVRYFGGIKLGTSGLIAAYREAARLSLEDAGKKEMYKMRELCINFPYVASNEVMKIIKREGICVTDRKFDNTCTMRLSIRDDMYESLSSRILGADGVSLSGDD